MMPATPPEEETMELSALCAYLDEYLDVAAFEDYGGAFNGLQLERQGEVTRLAAAVDACQHTIEAAAGQGADLLLVHHGLLWGGSGPFIGPLYRRLSAALGANLGVYSCHLPLDAHPEVGNAIGLVRALGLEPAAPFGEHRGQRLGFVVGCDEPREAWTARVEAAVGCPVRVLATGPARVRRVAVVTGSAASHLEEARAARCDTLLTGEARHATYLEAEEAGLNVVLAGHYATERFGVRALAAHLAERFGLAWSFLEHDTGL
jgi:dinuclear metal center YbgI/SA1388 family protein